MRGNDVQNLFVYAICVAGLIVAFFFANERPAKMLMTFAGLGAIAMLVGLSSSGTFGTFAFISGGLCCSVMWPCIFSLAVTGLGKYTSQGSAFLIMMILGGAIIPPMQGVVCDFDRINPNGIMGITFTHFSYFVPMLCFTYLIWHAVKTKSILKITRARYDQQMSGH